MAGQETWTPEQFREYHAKNKARDANAPRLKYGNKPATIDGIRFDSGKEADYYGRLKLRKRIGQIKDFAIHKVYELRVNGVLICTYECDFVIYHHNGTEEVVDVKSKATEGLAVFRMKKALMFAIYGITIKIA